MAEEVANELTSEQSFDDAFGSATAPADEGQDNGGEQAQNQPVQQEPAGNEPDPNDGNPEPQGVLHDTEDLEELKRKAHGYDSMLGRLKKEQQRAQELEQLLAGYQTPQAVQPQQQMNTQPGIEENLNAEIGKLPESYQPLFRENSTEGRRVRKLLEEYGEDHALSVAEIIQSKREMEAYRKQIQTDATKRAEDEHYRILSNAFPEYADAFAGDQVKMQELQRSVNSWINTLPYAHGAEMARIVQAGTPHEVVSMLTEYKKYAEAAGKKKAVRDNAMTNLAVPSRGGTPPAAQPDPNDFDAAFEEAVRQRK